MPDPSYDRDPLHLLTDEEYEAWLHAEDRAPVTDDERREIMQALAAGPE